MRWLLFLSRLAFICGIFFLLSLSLLIREWTRDTDLAGTIITIGYFMGMIIVPVTLLCYLFLWLFKKKPASVVPSWLIVANIIFLLVMLIYIYCANNPRPS